MPKFILKTERLNIRHLTSDDTEFILKLLNEPSYIKNIGDKKVRTIEQAQEYLQNGPIKSYRKNGFGLNCVTLKTSNTAIGICGLIKRSEFEFIDVGYAFLSEYWFRGFAKEAMSALFDYTRKNGDYKKIKAIVNPDNIASIKLLQKLNFQFQKKMIFGHEKAVIKLYNVDL